MLFGGGDTTEPSVASVASGFLGPKTVDGTPITDAERNTQNSMIDALNDGKTITIGD